MPSTCCHLSFNTPSHRPHLLPSCLPHILSPLTPHQTSKPDVVPLKVTHFHFAAWPDHGVPADKTSLIHFIQRVRKSHAFEGPPLLVHCSAGVGRTGTFMVLDSMIQRMKAEKETLNVYEFICHLRLKRPLMVQTEVSCPVELDASTSNAFASSLSLCFFP